MGKILIIGAGFAGLASLKKLCKYKETGAEIVLIDKKNESDFLPALPDIIGRGISPGHLSYNLNDMAEKRKFVFLQAEVTSIDLEKKEVIAGTNKLQYDYLIIASGTETNFYGQEQIRKYAYSLDSVEDAKKILLAVKSNAYDTFIVSGGGYTGVEVATSLRLYLDKNKIYKKIIIVERGNFLLGPLPEKLKSYTIVNLQRMAIARFLNATVTSIESDRISLSTGEVFTRAMLIWTAGVKTADFVWRLKQEKNPQGRLNVDDYLKIDNHCFVAGDAAGFSYKGKQIRMAVQFSIFQGRIAASNIIRSIKGKRLKKYRPIDLGYVVPMANNRSCGIVLGLFVKNGLATFLHFAMCVYRQASLRNKIGLLKDLLVKEKYHSKN